MRYYTKKDYFEPDSCYMTPADYTENNYKENELYLLDEVLSIIHCRRDTDHEYEPNCTCCGGLVAKPGALMHYPYPDEYIDQHNFMPTWIREDMFGEYGPEGIEFDLMDAWNSHYDTINQLFELLIRYSGRGDWFHYYDDLDPKSKRANDRYFAIRDRYNLEVEKALSELCRITEDAIDADCEYAQTDDAAQQWVEFMNDREWWMHKDRIESERERLVGMTAAYEDYAA